MRPGIVSLNGLYLRSTTVCENYVTKKKSLKFAACLPVNEFMLINYSTRNQNGILHRQDEVRLYSRFRLPRYILGDRLPDK
jgi:hypothetical protein